MLTKEELAQSYKTFSDVKIIQLAKEESGKLRPEAVEILKKEIVRRNLNENLLDWISFENNFFTTSEINDLKEKTKGSKYAHCQVVNEASGFHLHYISLFGTTFNADLIFCKKCQKVLERKALIKSLTLGWISTNLLRVPIFIIKKMVSFFLKHKENERIINNFIAKNTGLIRKYGFEKIEKLIAIHNAKQLKKYNKTLSDF